MNDELMKAIGAFGLVLTVFGYVVWAMWETRQ